jgi:site-specific recombinase XerD
MAHPTDDSWADWLRDWGYSITGRCQPQTVTVYRRGLRQFRDHLATHHPEVDGPESVQRRHVESFLATLATEGKSAATRRVRLMTLRSFFGWMIREPGVDLEGSPAAGVTAPEVHLPPAPVIGDAELRAVLGTCATGSFVDLRDAAMIRVLIACGLRRGELCSLDVADVDLNRGDLLVHGKGGKDRYVSIGGTKTALALSRYIRVRRKHPQAADPALILATRPDALGNVRLHGNGVAMMLNRRCVLAGIERFHPHQLRHTWAHVNKVAGLSDEDLERMAGWSSPLMVRRYGRALADERARGAHARLATGDRL